MVGWRVGGLGAVCGGVLATGETHRAGARNRR